MQGDRELCLAAGMDDYISKPIRPDDLQQILEKWLNPEVCSDMQAKTSDSDELVDMLMFNDAVEAYGQTARELFDFLVSQNELQYAKINQALRSGNAHDLERLTHTCIGSSGTCGITGVIKPLRELEKCAASRDLDAAEQIFKEVVQKFTHARQFLRNHIEASSTDSQK